MTQKTQYQFIALEGPAFAGKTTILNYLKENYPDRFSVIAESSEFVGGDKHFPAIPFTTFDDAKASTHFFLEMERLRCKKAQQAATESPEKAIVMDRATLLSSVIFYDLLESNFSDMHDFSESFKQHAVELFAKELAAGTFFVPEKIILVIPKNQTVFESRLSRGTKNSMFGHWSSVQFLVDQYKKVIVSHYPEKALILETKNTPENLKENAEKIIAFLDTPYASATTHTIFSNYQGKKTPSVFSPNAAEEKHAYQASIIRVRNLVEKAH